ncbi:MAG: hypothetical protein LUE31_12815 [Lachnospiraceae bacterium]|nr:hypothetical protein [Lachnospiraceae bacterium]
MIATGAFLALVVVVFLAIWYFRTVEVLAVTEPMYTYVGGMISEYPDGFTLRHEDDTMYVVVDEDRQYLPDVMFYCADRDAVILQETMVWNQKAAGVQLRVDYFSEVRLEGGVVVIEDGDATVSNPEGFLHNGSNTYLLLEPATLTWNDESVELSALSTVTAEYGSLLEVYNYEENTAFSEDLTDSETKLVFSDGAEVLVVTDQLKLTNGSWYLLITDPSVLNDIE